MGRERVERQEDRRKWRNKKKTAGGRERDSGKNKEKETSDKEKENEK